jgi:GPH family glycoside/pentoside/hexuronide:cation symporter
VQSASALWGITLAFTLLPGAFAALKALAIGLVPLSAAQIALIERELGARRAAAARA